MSNIWNFDNSKFTFIQINIHFKFIDIYFFTIFKIYIFIKSTCVLVLYFSYYIFLKYFCHSVLFSLKNLLWQRNYKSYRKIQSFRENKNVYSIRLFFVSICFIHNFSLPFTFIGIGISRAHVLSNISTYARKGYRLSL